MWRYENLYLQGMNVYEYAFNLPRVANCQFILLQNGRIRPVYKDMVSSIREIYEKITHKNPIINQSTKELLTEMKACYFTRTSRVLPEGGVNRIQLNSIQILIDNRILLMKIQDILQQ